GQPLPVQWEFGKRMTADQLLSRLDGVRERGRGWVARCPAHDDRAPSLTICEGDRGLLLHCFALCPIEAICNAIGLGVPDLFYDRAQNPCDRREAQRKRQVERQRREAIRNVQGLTLDVRRESDVLIGSARSIDISKWPLEQLDAVLNRLADAYDSKGYDDE